MITSPGLPMVIVVAVYVSSRVLTARLRPAPYPAPRWFVRLRKHLRHRVKGHVRPRTAHTIRPGDAW